MAAGSDGGIRLPGHDVFISYSSTQRDAAAAVGGALSEAGVTYWLAEKDVRGSSYGGKITAAIKASRVFILIFSDAAQQSTHVVNEVSIARDSSASTIVLRTDLSAYNNEIDYSLHHLSWIDAATVPFEEGLAKLILAVQDQLGGAVPPAQSPGPRQAVTLPLTEEWVSGGREVIVTLDQDAPSASIVRRWLLSCRVANKYASSSWKLAAGDYETAREELQKLVQ